MAQQVTTATLLEDIFEKPSVSRMVSELDPAGFEDFVAYAFRRAGYFVHNVARARTIPGVDLAVYANARSTEPIAYIQVKHFDPSIRKVSSPEVHQFASSPNTSVKVARLLITTTDFAQPAYDFAPTVQKLRLVNGDRFLRYITYVRESRHPESSAPAIAPERLFQADAIARRQTNLTRVLVVANNKGGVGKTTTALNLGFGLAQLDQRVLLVDLDAQANLTQSLPFKEGENARAPSMTDYFMDRAGLNDVVRPTEFKRLWVAPASPDLRLADQERHAWEEAEIKFASDLHDPNVRPPLYQDSQPFDWIIVDTPPSMLLHTRVALGASHYVLAPVTPGPFADSGIKQLLSTCEAMRCLMGTGVEVLGYLVTRWQDNAVNRDTLSRFKYDSVKAGLNPFLTTIPTDQSVDKAHLNTGAGGKRNLFSWTRRGAGEAYQELVKEIVKHVSND